MSQAPNIQEMRAIQQALTRQRLDMQNKEAARQQLLRIQLLLARKTPTPR